MSGRFIGCGETTTFAARDQASTRDRDFAWSVWISTNFKFGAGLSRQICLEKY